MTVRDRELLELLREEPELLAVADAVATTQQAPRRSPRRGRAVAALAAVVVAVVAVALLSPWDSGPGRGLVVQRAFAALADRGPVLHAVFVFPGGFESSGPQLTLRLDLQTGRLRRVEDHQEVWYDRERSLIRHMVTRDERVLADGASSGKEAELSGSLLDLFRESGRYRDALANGKAKVAGTGRWHGRSVYWLEIGAGGGQFGVDRETYRLLAFRGGAEKREFGILLFEYVPRSEGQFVPSPPDTSAPTFSFERITLEDARNALGVPAVWVGQSIEGLPFRRASLAKACPSTGPCLSTERKEVRLVYGSGELSPFGLPRGKGVEIAEARAGTPLAGFLTGEGVPPPAGFADLTNVRGGYHVEAGPKGERLIPPQSRWIADLSAGRVWVRVTASRRSLAIAVARALSPIPAKAG